MLTNLILIVMVPRKRELQMTDIKQLITKFEVTTGDIKLVRKLGDLVMPEIDKHLDSFYSWMSDHPEYDHYFANDQQRLQRVRKMQIAYWNSLFNATLDEDWYEERRNVGEVHANIDLPNDIYFAGVSFSAQSIANAYKNKASSDQTHDFNIAFHKILFLDSFIVIDRISEIQKEKLNASAQELVEMSTPVTPIYQGVLLLPLLGIIDSGRAKEIMQRTLAAISKYRATVLLLDISGVSVMDTQVANQLLKIAGATKFMGCQTMISGLSPEIAQTLVELGINTGDINTKATLEDSFQAALEKLNLNITPHAL